MDEPGAADGRSLAPGQLEEEEELVDTVHTTKRVGYPAPSFSVRISSS